MNKIQAIDLALNIAYDVVEQGKIGSCVAHTIKNLIKLHGRLNNNFAKDIEVSFSDVYARRATPPIDNGMYPDIALRKVIEEGVAIDIYQDIFTKEELKAYKIKPNTQNYRIKPIKSFNLYQKMSQQRLEEFLKDDFNRHGLRPIQFSINSYANWWNGEYPQASGEIYGGHSFVILNLVFDDKGVKRVFAIDSAYSTWRMWTIKKGWRMPDLETLSKAMRSMRTITFDTFNKFNALATATINYGERGQMVKLLQEYLISEGFSIPAGVTGYFGEQTRKALSQWQIKYLKKDYGGKYWGKISQSMFKALTLI